MSLAWWLVSRTARARTTMRRLAPAVVLVSFVPDLLVGVFKALPGTTWTGVVGLMVMHLVVAAAGLASLSRALPLRDAASADEDRADKARTT